MKRRNPLIAALLLLATGPCVVYPIAYKNSVETLTITVKDKERISTGSGDLLSHKYLVFTETETFENTDSLLFWKFNSSDVQSALVVGGSITVKVAGWRVPALSLYRNIIE